MVDGLFDGAVRTMRGIHIYFFVHYATSRQVAGSIPDEAIAFFN
jgi:hypothetical protein